MASAHRSCRASRAPPLPQFALALGELEPRWPLQPSSPRPSRRAKATSSLMPWPARRDGAPPPSSPWSVQRAQDPLRPWGGQPGQARAGQESHVRRLGGREGKRWMSRAGRATGERRGDNRRMTCGPMELTGGAHITLCQTVLQYPSIPLSRSFLPNRKLGDRHILPT